VLGFDIQHAKTMAGQIVNDPKRYVAENFLSQLQTSKGVGSLNRV